MAEGPQEGLTVDQALAVLDTYNRQIDVVTRQLSFLQAVLNEVGQARDALEGLEKEPGKDLLIPLGANTFIHGQATDKKKVLTGIGSGLTVEKTWTDTIKGLEKREQEVRSEMQRMSETAAKLQQEAAALQDEIQMGLEAPTSAR